MYNKLCSNTIERIDEKDRCISKYLWICMCILILSIVPMIIISIFSRPCADDYNYAISTYHLIQSGDWNIFDLLKTAYEVDFHYYNTWQGLYSSAFILSLQPGIFGEKYYFMGHGC